MSCQPLSPDLANNPEQHPAATVGEDMLYFGRVLRRFVEAGDQFVELLQQEATMIATAQAELAARELDPQTVPSSPASKSDLVDAYERITRSARKSIMLYQKLFEPPKKPVARHRIAARKKIIRDVEDAIHRNAPPGEAERLHAELLERLDRPELEYEIAERPIADIVMDINRDLGITGLYDGHPWKRRIPHDIAILNARAEQLAGGPPSEKLLALLASAPPRPPVGQPDTGTEAERAEMSDPEMQARLPRDGPSRDP